MSSLLTQFINEYKTNPEKLYYTISHDVNNIKNGKKSSRPKSIDKTYLKYYYMPKKSRNNENINLIPPRHYSNLSNFKNQQLNKEIVSLRYNFGDKNKYVANLTNINNPNEFYSNAIKYEEASNRKIEPYRNKPIITFTEPNNKNNNRKNNYNFINSFLTNSLIKPGIFKATNTLRNKKKYNEQLRTYRSFDDQKDLNSLSIEKYKKKSRDEFSNYMLEMSNLKKTLKNKKN